MRKVKPFVPAGVVDEEEETTAKETAKQSRLNQAYLAVKAPSEAAGHQVPEPEGKPEEERPILD